MGTDREQAVAANRARLLAVAAPPPPVPADVADDLLRSTVCGRCGYDLTGLPLPTGICPECGRPFGGPEVCLYGYGVGSKKTALNRKPLTKRQMAVRWVAVAVALVVVGPHWRMWMQVFGEVFWWVASVVAGLVVATWRGATGQPSDAVQVRLTPAGASQLERGFGPIPYDKVDRAKPVPWRRVRRVSIRPEADGLVRVSMDNDPAWWWPQVDHVDAVVRCPPDAVAALRQRIAEWRAAADRR